MVKLEDDEILRILKESQKPLGLSEIKKQLNKPKNTIQYHLKKLTKNGEIISNDKKYSLDKTEVEKREEIKNEVIDLLSTEELSPIDLQQKLGFDERKIYSALLQLEGAGLIKEGPNSLAKRSGMIRRRRTTYDTKYCRETKYTLTYLAYSKIGVCPICKEKIRQKDLILTAFFRTNYNFEPQPWKNVLIHLDCIPNSEAYDTIYGKHEGSVFCEYCGLPLSPKMLPRQSITYKSIKCHFSEMELEIIGLFERLSLREIIRSVSAKAIVEEKYKFAVRPEDSTIEEVYISLKMDIPNWIADKLKNETIPKDSSPENNNIEPLSWEIDDDLSSLEADLSALSSAEKFIKVLKKYRSDAPTDYDINSRIRDVWVAAQNIRIENEKNIQRMYEKLLGPAGGIYAYTDEAFGTEQYDFDRQMTDAPYGDDESTIFSQTITFKHGDKFYHPFCAEKLGLKDNGYCNNISSKGGEK